MPQELTLYGAAASGSVAVEAALTLLASRSSSSAGRALYDKMAEHRGFIVYAREL